MHKITEVLRASWLVKNPSFVVSANHEIAGHATNHVWVKNQCRDITKDQITSIFKYPTGTFRGDSYLS